MPEPGALSRDGVLSRLLDSTDIAFLLACFCGRVEFRKLRMVSAYIGRSAAKLLPSLQARYPGLIFVCGGYTGLCCTATAECFDLARGVWEALPQMLNVRCGAVGAAVDGHVYICGGADGTKRLNSVERYDVAKGTWEEAASMLSVRFCAAAGVLASEIYVAGGTDGDMQCLASAEKYCTASGVWMQAPSMLLPRSRSAAAVLQKCLYVCGGRDAAEIWDTVERYAFERGCWERVAPIPSNLSGGSAASLQNKLYVCGGSCGLVRSDAVFMMDPSVGAWEALAPWMQASCAAVVGAGNSMYIFGGTTGPTLLKSARSLNVQNMAEETLPPMSHIRVDAASVLLVL